MWKVGGWWEIIAGLMGLSQLGGHIVMGEGFKLGVANGP